VGARYVLLKPSNLYPTATCLVLDGPFLPSACAEATADLSSLLIGQFDGAGAIERAYNDFKAGKLEKNRTGIMIHYVIAKVDRGEPIMTREVECRAGETLEELEQRIHEHEHELIVEATAKVVGELLAKRDRA
jgi:phosphoribosylglycinamide formyltransferase